jgi:hypothetical protein
MRAGRCTAAVELPADWLHSPPIAFDWSVTFDNPDGHRGKKMLGPIGRCGCLPCARRHLVDALYALHEESSAFGLIMRVDIFGDGKCPVAVAVHDCGGVVQWVSGPPAAEQGCAAT